MSKRVLCTMAYGAHAELFDVTGPALERYAKAHEYEFIVLEKRLAPGRPPAWDKVVMLHSLVGESDLTVWIDCDALVLADAPDIAGALSPDRFLHLVEHKNRGGRVPNTGVLTLQGGDRSKRFLDRVWNQRRFVHDRWWENAAVNHLLGYRDIGRVRRVVPSRWRGGVGLLDRSWNSIPEDPSPRPKIVHFPGVPIAERLHALRHHAARI